MVTKTQVHSDLPIPPGETLAEELAARKLSQAELARRMGRPLQTVNMIVTGKKRVTAETALGLERVLGIPAHIWLGLQAEYDETRARLAQRPVPALSRASLGYRVRTDGRSVGRYAVLAKKPSAVRRAAKRK